MLKCHKERSDSVNLETRKLVWDAVTALSQYMLVRKPFYLFVHKMETADS